MQTIDILELATILRDAAKAEVVPRFRRLDPETIHTKSGPTDLVTEGDTAAERVITAQIARRWPGALVIGEEGVAADPALLDRMSDAPLAITIDPIDGTANYAAGLPLFAVMASVVANGEAIAGILYDPMGDDWVLAERGGGAWLHRPDGTSVRVKSADPVPVAQTVAHVSVSFLPKAVKPQILANLSKLSIAANYRCAGHDYRTMASGHCHALLFNKLLPWDHVPGTLICAEAGAHVARFDGSPYLPHHRDGGLLLAADRDSWSVLRREVFTL
jgi:fructose-1,6-bisphosphatase/inositol monophosphatase family enzyme